jgi:hypothetical protein
MKTKRLFAALALLVATAGCVLVSGQFLINFDLGTLTVTSPTNVVGRVVDLNTISDYTDHKDNLKGLADVAVLGTIKNNGTEAVDVQIWMTPDAPPTLFTLDTDVRANGILLWGPFHLEPGETKHVDWDTSAGLFDPLGKVTLIGEIKGDGVFAVYALGASGTYNFEVTDGQVVLVLNAGA